MNLNEAATWRWFRVKEAGSAFYGYDVSGHLLFHGDGPDVLLVKKMRRCDVVIGDRPWQTELGPMTTLSIELAALEKSPIQDDVVEIDRRSPYGKFVDEETISNGEHQLQVVSYERGVQIALTGPHPSIASGRIRMASNYWSVDSDWERSYLRNASATMLEAGNFDGLTACITRGKI